MIAVREQNLGYMDELNRWISKVADKELLSELKSMDDSSIEDAFYRDLAFGTGGLRGIIGAGTNRMNKYTVRKATQGLANYILKTAGEEGKKKGVAISYDCRHNPFRPN